ncbi:MAG: hypothetical protein WA941_03325 [Nitrososphaeraceae archaeon]
MNTRINRIGYDTKKFLLVSLFGIILFYVYHPFNSGLAKNNTFQIFPSDSSPYGLGYDEWVEKWLQWILSIPQERNPLLDPNGKFCGEGQTDPNVFFLAGTLGGKADRTCIISGDKALFFPILNVPSDLIRETEFGSKESLKRFLENNQDAVTLISASIDNTSLTSRDTLRTQSQFFNLTYPEDDDRGVYSEYNIAVSNGTWIMLEPLTEGYHHINFKGVLVDSASLDIDDLIIDMTYHINILD